MFSEQNFEALIHAAGGARNFVAFSVLGGGALAWLLPLLKQWLGPGVWEVLAPILKIFFPNLLTSSASSVPSGVQAYCKAIREACPEADVDFRLTCIENGISIEEAKSNFIRQLLVQRAVGKDPKDVSQITPVKS